MNLVELYDIVIQAQSLNGVPLSNGHVYIYALGRTRLMDTWSDVAGESLNTNPVILDNAGQAKIYVSDAFDYTLVFTDEYDNEIFSVDKYLLSQGAHSHADVAVAPSESIAVSSYNVGEVTVYVPYLTGQLGKVYTGIDPIVVNNTEDKISANHVPLGVQDPLYFVQDDEEGCIIGFSGQTVPEGVMTESALGFENNKITGYNGSAFSAGNEYEAGDNIDITNGVISGKDWSNEINDASAAATAWTDSQGYLTGVDLSEYAKTDFVISAIDSSTSGLLPTSAFATASGSFITALPSDLATTGWVDSQGYLTAVDIPESAVWNATTQTVSANSAAWAGGTANPQIPVTGINGIKISESGDKVVFEVSADYALNSALQNVSAEITGMIPAPFDPSYLSGQIDTKLDSAIYAEDSGKFLTAHQSLAGYATENWVTSKGYLTAETDWSDTITAASANAYNEATAAIPTGLATEDWVTAQGYLTAHQDLSDYQTTAGMTAYQPAGDYLTTADSANFYTTANESGFITGVPVGTMNESAFEYDENDKISGYNGSAFAGGSDVPEGVMVESGLEYNAVNEISGYNGSAIAQYGAEKQFIVHDDTLVHLSNSAQYALGVNISAVAQLLGVDETVLWSGTATSITSVNLSETLSNFKRARITFNPYTSTTSMPKEIKEFLPEENKKILSLTQFVSPGILNLFKTEFSYAGTTFNIESQYYFDGKWTSANNNSQLQLYEVVGIGRKN